MLKKAITSILIFIHLFNIGGQLVLHQYLAYLSDRFFNEQTSKNLYNTTDLTEVRIPVNMPGIPDWGDYVKINGQVQFKNSSYNYVKIKVTSTAIYLMCVPNYETTHLFTENIICAKQINDIPVPRKEHVPFGKTTIKAYHYQSVHYKFLIPVLLTKGNCFCSQPAIQNPFIKGPCQPPDFLAGYFRSNFSRINI